MTDNQDIKHTNINKEIILGEIDGKNAAIHAYDKIIWMIRSGYLSLLYGGWAIILAGIVEQDNNIMQHKNMILIMFSITFSLTIGAYILDKNYLQRKFRVIFTLNKLLELTFGLKNIETIDAVLVKELRDYLKVSGDADNSSYDTDGYKQARTAENTIYLFSVLPLMLGLLYVYK